ncbi:hypothetical protein Bbelb_299980 [Branchiostoma belcheri]|nr:hypothetical protein Bbelb_299980 [Branchiostoma belcheri]
MFPDDVPRDVDKLKIGFNSIANVSYLPSLPRLSTLDLRMNCIETFSWTSLLAVPKLRRLHLQSNKLRVVQLDTVIEHLPKLEYVDLTYNKLVSFSQYQLGWPRMNTGMKVLLYGNPLSCDCTLHWLVDKMVCLNRQACKGKGSDCCSSCKACFLTENLNKFSLCYSPRGLPVSSLFNESTLALINLMDCEPSQSTASTVTSAATSTTIATSEPHNTLLTNAVENNTTPNNLNKTVNSTMVGTNSSRPDSNTGKKGKGQPLRILYIVAYVAESLLVVGFIFCCVRLHRKHRLCCKCRKDVNHHLHQLNPPGANSGCHGNADGAVNHSEPAANQITPPISNSATFPACQSTTAEGLNGERLATQGYAEAADSNSADPDEQIAPYAIAYDVEEEDVTPYAEGHLRDHDSLSESDASDSPDVIVSDDDDFDENVVSEGVTKFYYSGDNSEIREGSSIAYVKKSCKKRYVRGDPSDNHEDSSSAYATQSRKRRYVRGDPKEISEGSSNFYGATKPCKRYLCGDPKEIHKGSSGMYDKTKSRNRYVRGDPKEIREESSSAYNTTKSCKRYVRGNPKEIREGSSNFYGATKPCKRYLSGDPKEIRKGSSSMYDKTKSRKRYVRGDPKEIREESSSAYSTTKSCKRYVRGNPKEIRKGSSNVYDATKPCRRYLSGDPKEIRKGSSSVYESGPVSPADVSGVHVPMSRDETVSGDRGEQSREESAKVPQMFMMQQSPVEDTLAHDNSTPAFGEGSVSKMYGENDSKETTPDCP